MTLNRSASRMCKAIILADIAFLAGQVHDDLTADVNVQTQTVLASVNAVLAQHGGTNLVPAPRVFPSGPIV